MPKKFRSPPTGSSTGWFGVDRDLRAIEGRRTEHERGGRSVVAVHVVELFVEVAHVVHYATGDADGDGAQVAEGIAVGGEERASGVTGDARGNRRHDVGPAVAVIAVADADLRAEGCDTKANDRVAVRVHEVACGCARGVQTDRPAPMRDVRVDQADVGGVDPDERQVVVGARI